MGFNCADLREGITTKVEELDEFKLSNQSPDFLKRTPKTIINKAFTVAVPTSRDTGERQRRRSYIFTPFTVSFYIKMRPSDYNLDYNNALRTEAEVIGKILEGLSGSPVNFYYVESTREVEEEQNYVLISVTFQAHHTL